MIFIAKKLVENNIGGYLIENLTLKPKINFSSVFHSPEGIFMREEALFLFSFVICLLV